MPPIEVQIKCQIGEDCRAGKQLESGWEIAGILAVGERGWKSIPCHRTESRPWRNYL
jgi:hypothetical protein